MEAKLKHRLAKQRESNELMSSRRFEVKLLEPGMYQDRWDISVEVLATNFKHAGRVARSKYPNAVVIGVSAIF